MKPVLYLPCDSAAQALGAEAVALAIRGELARRGIDGDLVRTGSRGMVWREPLLEVATAQGRVGYGPLRPGDVPGVIDAVLGGGAPHPLCLGVVAQLDYLRRQTRLGFARCGVIDPLALADYAAQGGWQGLQRALALGRVATLAQIEASGLRGRGGAGFPAAIKWRGVAEQAGPEKYIVCNADEGDSGTFADRMLMEGDPFLLIEGMLIAGLTLGARQGIIYVRSEYPRAAMVLRQAIAAARRDGLLGTDLAGPGSSFEVTVFLGAGSYVCGEETALLESLEGRRGMVRAKPPLPAHRGLFGKPTLINNVLTLAAIPWILAEGGAAYAAFGTGRSRGTQAFQLAGNIRQAGLFEAPFGLTLGEVVQEIGGGTATGRPVRAVQVGGPLGAYFPPALFDTRLDYESMAERGGMLGHGGIVVFDDSVDMLAQAQFAMEFCSIESCGKCTPCRIGSVRGMEILGRMRTGPARQGEFALLEELCDTMTQASLCAMGGLTPLPVQSALRHFRQDFTPARETMVG